MGVTLHARAAKSRRIQLTWKAKGREHGAATVERKEGKAAGPGRFAAIGSAAPRAGQWVDRQVKAGVTYTYRLRRGAGAQAAYSNAASAQAARR